MGRALEYDVVVIGSGFGGSTSALRLTEKGYRVAVLEAGRRFDETNLPKTSWDVRSFFWAPKLGCLGIQRLSLLKDVLILSGAGVGGGSLVYANTLYEPLPPFYADEQWGHITDWRDELAPFYDQAKRMLGVVDYPTTTPADDVMRAVAEEMGVGDTFHATPVGVLFTDPGVEIDDPYFGGAGPKRRGCIQCGECMTGCRHGAKNTLLKNYLYLAEQAGAEVHPVTTVTAIRPLPDGRYAIDTERTGAWFHKQRRTFVANDVVFAAGTMGTQKLLHRMRDEGHLPNLSERLGELTRTNSEAILGARAFRRDVDFSTGVAITSSFHPDDHTHIEPVRYGKGSNAMGLLTTALADGGGRSRLLTWLAEVVRHPVMMMRNLSMRRWSEQTIIALVMQTRDNSITCHTKRGLLGRRKLTSKQGHGEPNPTWIPAGHEAVRRIAARIGGFAGGGWNDVFNIPMTAHFLGGAPIGDSPASGVIDAYHRVYGHRGLHVVDGAAISANLGVNPSLTITAQAERAISLWPNKGEPDVRPALGAPYRRIDPIDPVAPTVPIRAPAALPRAVGIGAIKKSRYPQVHPLVIHRQAPIRSLGMLSLRSKRAVVAPVVVVPLDTREIDRQVISMFSLIPERLSAATAAFLDGDRDAARQLIESDEAIDLLQVDVERLVQTELTHQPIPDIELRYLVTVLRIVPELERSADLVEHIALRTQPAISGALSPRARGQIDTMGRVASEMWRAAALAYVDRDSSAALSLRDRDDELDDLHVQLTHELAGAQLEPSMAIELGLVARFFERLGDHAVNVVRRLNYISAPAEESA